MHLEHALSRYLTQLRANGRSEHTVLQAQRHVRLLARWLAFEQRSSELDNVDEETIAEFLCTEAACKTLAGKTKTPGSVNALRSSLKSFFAAATRAEWLSRDPARFIRRARCSAPPPRALTPRESERLLAVLGEAEGPAAQRDRMLFMFMLRTGVRLSSALGIEVRDVDVHERTVLLRNTKNRDVHRVFLPGETADELGRFLAGRNAGPVFARMDGMPLSSRHAQRRFRALRERAGLPATVTSHSLRHSFAMGLYERTGDVLLVRRALGHRSIVSTLVYAHASEGRLRRVLTI